jgi:Ca2+-binding EF-hand superfamily protein
MDMQARKAALDLLDADLDIADDDGGDDEILYVENKATVKSANEVRRLIQTNFTNIRPAFRRFDENHDMMLSVDELCRACNDQGIPLSVFEANRLLAQIDKDHSGAVSNYEFMRFFGEASDAGGLSAQLIAADDAKAARRVAIDQALEGENKHGFALEGTAADADAKLKKRIADNFKNVREAFRRFDADGDGMLSAEELCYACQSAGVKMKKDEADRLLIMVDNDGSGSVSNKEFMVYFGESADVGGLSSTLQKNNTAETAYKQKSDHLTKLAAPINMDALGKVARAEMNEKESTAMISNVSCRSDFHTSTTASTPTYSVQFHNVLTCGPSF